MAPERAKLFWVKILRVLDFLVQKVYDGFIKQGDPLAMNTNYSYLIADSIGDLCDDLLPVWRENDPEATVERLASDEKGNETIIIRTNGQTYAIRVSLEGEE